MNITNKSNKIEKLKKDFDVIKSLNENITNIFDNLNTKIIKLEYMYNNFLTNNKTTLFIFGLDSFKFQNKLINDENSFLRKNYDLLCNRMYCDYYKLYRIILKDILKDTSLKKIHNTLNIDKYEKYNYLDIYKGYDIEYISDMFSEIVNLIILLNDQFKTTESIIRNYKSKKRIGININNFIYTHVHRNKVLNEQIFLYIKYLSFLVNLHSKYFIRFTSKVTTIYKEITSDINFENTNDEEEITEYKIEKIITTPYTDENNSSSSSSSEEDVSEINILESDINLSIEKITKKEELSDSVKEEETREEEITKDVKEEEKEIENENKE